MRRYMNNNKGLSLVEIIVSSIILALIIGGLVSTFVSGKRWLGHSRAQMTGGELGKYFLDPLALAVRHDQWDESAGDYEADTGQGVANDLCQDCPHPGNAVRMNNKDYTRVYTITTIPTLNDPAKYGQARKVTTVISWTE